MRLLNPVCAVPFLFAPALLAPMLLTYERRLRPALLFLAAFAAVTVAALLWPAIDPGLKTVYDRTIGFQSGRDSPFCRMVSPKGLASRPGRNAPCNGKAAPEAVVRRFPQNLSRAPRTPGNTTSGSE